MKRVNGVDGDGVVCGPTPRPLPACIDSTAAGAVRRCLALDRLGVPLWWRSRVAGVVGGRGAGGGQHAQPRVRHRTGGALRLLGRDRARAVRAAHVLHGRERGGLCHAPPRRRDGGGLTPPRSPPPAQVIFPKELIAKGARKMAVRHATPSLNTPHGAPY